MPKTTNLLKPLFFIIPFISFFFGYYLISHYFFNTKIIVPSLIGKQLSECATSLARQKLSVRFLSEREEPNLPEGTILEQIPAAGQSIRPQQQILIITTKKPTAPTTPHLFGLPEQEITTAAQHHGIAIKQITVASNKKTSLCCAQSPATGQLVPEKIITAAISEQKQNLVIMPNLYEKPVWQICNLLKNHNIKLELFYQHQRVAPSSYQEGTCINQNPTPGSLINISKPITLQIEIDF